MKRYIILLCVLLAGIFLGWLFFHSSSRDETESHVADKATAEVWTCSMHPEIRRTEPGDCPICGMDLIPLIQNSPSSSDPEAIHLTRDAAQLANVLTTKVMKHEPVKEVRLYGKVQPDERLYQSQVAHVPGRIEKLTVNFTGESVVKGQVLAEIYSPELITAQQELLETAKTKQLQPELYEAAREKLLQWKLTEKQIEDIEKSGAVVNNFEVLSNTSGTVTSKRVNTGDHVSSGTSLFEIADLSKMWVLFDAYESDLQFLNKGERVTFTLQALPGTKFTGKIVFIDPVIDPVTRVTKIRVETDNPSGRLKPEMFATGIVSATMSEFKNTIIVPHSAVLWTGKRSIVYVKQTENDDPVFKLREVELGPDLGGSYIITDGLTEGEEIVTSGTFSVDAAAQLEGKPSMMNQPRISGEAHQDNDRKAVKINMNFLMLLNKVFNNYIELKNALIASDKENAKVTANTVNQALSEVDIKMLPPDSIAEWEKLSGRMEQQIGLIISSDEIDDQRLAFSEFNNQFYKAIKSYGLHGITAYYQYCPMAFDNNGAYWLSESQTIKNPYFGDEMLTCGETTEILKY
jgi:Cu(I)/Ag(I) efflux system membrane fusion protein